MLNVTILRQASGVYPGHVPSADTKAAQQAPAGGEILSAKFIQIYTPLIWGKVNLGRPSVTVGLEHAAGTNVIGVVVQTTKAAPNT
jgi:hypothetical protein